jgi:hypothetical protein
MRVKHVIHEIGIYLLLSSTALALRGPCCVVLQSLRLQGSSQVLISYTYSIPFILSLCSFVLLGQTAAGGRRLPSCIHLTIPFH